MRCAARAQTVRCYDCHASASIWRIRLPSRERPHPWGLLGSCPKEIADERREANRIKSEQPILAIIGNPPYRRLEEGENRTLVGDWMDGLWDDLKEPVRDAGQGGQLNTFPELSIAFWRWADLEAIRGGQRARTWGRRVHFQPQVPDRMALRRFAQNDARAFR